MSSLADSVLTLTNCDKTMRVTSAKGDIPEAHSYFTGKLDGSKSLYIVYSSPDFSKAEKGSKPGVIIDTTDPKPLGFNARSVNAFNKNGIIFFEYPNYAGEGANFTQSVGELGYGSSFIVNAGVWELFLSGGEQLVMDGSSQFGPDSRVTSTAGKIVSAKKIQD